MVQEDPTGCVEGAEVIEATGGREERKLADGKCYEREEEPSEDGTGSEAAAQVVGGRVGVRRVQLLSPKGASS